MVIIELDHKSARSPQQGSTDRTVAGGPIDICCHSCFRLCSVPKGNYERAQCHLSPSADTVEIVPLDLRTVVSMTFMAMATAILVENDGHVRQ
mmetsp:Transcript_20936/g.36029  ORF Transcript_20936/g.36029 Transcript_20936/m.36029 type:complete len:93 (-) Transcript_20936:542-820(-)